MNIETCNQIGRRMEELVRLRSKPIALKWYEHADDVPENAIRPLRDLKKHMALCQAFTYARMKGATIAMVKEDHWCWNPLIAYGAVECVPGQPQFDEVVKFIGIPDKEKAEKFFAKFPRLPLGKYEAVVVAPLSDCSFEPDVVLVYAPASTINYLCRCVKATIGGTFTSTFDGIDSCIYCTVPTFQTNEFRLTLPDPGDVERARARDDEVILTIPQVHLEGLMQSIENLSRFMPNNDALQELSLDFPRPPFYNTLFDIWGLEKGDDWGLAKK